MEPVALFLFVFRPPVLLATPKGFWLKLQIGSMSKSVFSSTRSRVGSISHRVLELLLFVLLGILVWTVSARYDIMERILRFSNAHEDWEIDEYIFLSIYFMFAMLVFALRRWLEVRKSERELEREAKELETALEQVKRLQGILPICASCKKVRDDKGYWQEVEAYITEHSEAQFSHGLCEACLERLYPEVSEDARQNHPDGSK